MRIDLQLHSNHSDGYLTIRQLVRLVARHKIRVAALTDHNTTAGIQEFSNLCRQTGIKPIPGVEIYTRYGRHHLNVLWYNFKIGHSLLENILKQTRVKRRSQVKKHLKKLGHFGLRADETKIFSSDSQYIPVNKIADQIISLNPGIIQKIFKTADPHQENVIHYFFYNYEKNLVMPEVHINLENLLKIKKKIGGQIIFNHPGKYHQDSFSFYQKLKTLGLDGIEVFSPHHSIGAISRLFDISCKLNLIVTGGSDFHLNNSYGPKWKNALEYFHVNTKNLNGIQKIIA